MARPAAQTYRKPSPCLRLAAKLVKRSVRDDDAATHDGDPIRHQLGLAKHMRRDDESGAARSLLAEKSPHVCGRHRVKTGGPALPKEPGGRVAGGAAERHPLG